MMHHRGSSERGTSFLELTIAMAIVGVAVMILIQQITISLHERHEDVQSQFAHRKAVGILAELQASVDQGEVSSAADLEAYAHADLDPTLTTRLVDAPDHIMSGNVRLGSGEWKWYRLITIEPIEGSDRSLYVRVAIKNKNEHGAVYLSAAASGILNITVEAEPHVKEFDVYVLALAEAPSLWQPLGALRAQVQMLADEIGGANPNLRLRLHWITKLGYGRDATYVPFVNETTSADAAAPWAYWYPGKLARGAGASQLYSAELISGRVRTEAGVLHDYDAQTNAWPHAVADRFNHCMRTPRARALFEQRVAAGLETREEPPLQLLLADMHADPDRFRNALFINLHGEGLPFPALRNVSDAAKDPVGHPGVRVVTHPARLHTPRGGDGTSDAIADLIAEVEAEAAKLGAGDDDDDDDDKIGKTLTKAAENLRAARDRLGLAPADFDGARTNLALAQEQLDKANDSGYAEGYAMTLRVRDLSADCKARSNAMAAPELRVYAYKVDPDAGAVTLEEPITVQIMGVDLTESVNGADPSAATTLEIRRLFGGVDPATGLASGSNRVYDHFFESVGVPPMLAAKSDAHEMCYEVGYATSPEPHTWIRLYNTPLITPLYDDEGLVIAQRLYGMEYIPSPVDRVVRDLDQDGNGAKNTARWRIRIPASALPNADTQVTIHTRIGTDVTTGRMWPTPNQPTNLSTTYVWWTDSPLDVPLTERYQFLGDPRHNPYEDLADGGASFPNGYNWWFDDLRDGGTDVGSQWTCLDRARLQDGLGAGVVEDLPRMMQVWREALQATGSVFTNPGGPLAGRLLLGGEIVLPGEVGTPAAVSLHGALAGRASLIGVDDVSPGTGPSAAPSVEAGVAPLIGRPVLVTPEGDFWVKEWLGELVPDAIAEKCLPYGNVPTGELHREVRQVADLLDLPNGSDWSYPSGSTPADLGGATLLQSSTQSTFAHVAGTSTETATLSADAFDLSQRIGVSIAHSAPARLPFTLGAQLSSTLPQRAWPDAFPDHSLQLLETLATTDRGSASAGVLRLAAPGSSTRVAFFVPFGDTPLTGDEHRALTVEAFTFALRALHVAGEPARSDGVAPVPVLEVTHPMPQQRLKDPATLNLSWRTAFTRFDGEPYTARYPTPFAASEAQLGYVITYRAADSEDWFYASDDQPAEAGLWPDDPLRMIADISAEDESFVLFLPTGIFTAGEWVIRIDCFHRDGRLHVAHHEVHITIDR